MDVSVVVIASLSVSLGDACVIVRDSDPTRETRLPPLRCRGEDEENERLESGGSPQRVLLQIPGNGILPERS